MDTLSSIPLGASFSVLVLCLQPVFAYYTYDYYYVPVGAIVGGCIGGLVLVGGLISLCVRYCSPTEEVSGVELGNQPASMETLDVEDISKGSNSFAQYQTDADICIGKPDIPYNMKPHSSSSQIVQAQGTRDLDEPL